MALKLAAVDGSGVVHQYDRQTTRPEKFIELFRSGSDINGCEITRRAVSEFYAGGIVRQHHMLIKF